MPATDSQPTAGRPKAGGDYVVDQFDPARHQPAEIARLHLSIRRQQQAAGEVVFPDIASSQTDLQDIDRCYLKTGGQFFVASDGAGRIVGFVGLKKTGPGGGELKRLAVIAACRRSGIGSRLVGRAVDWARAGGWQKLSLATGRQEKAKNIYLHHGFSVVGRSGDQQDFLMEVELLPPGG